MKDRTLDFGGGHKTVNPPYVLKTYGGSFISIIQICWRRIGIFISLTNWVLQKF